MLLIKDLFCVSPKESSQERSLGVSNYFVVVTFPAQGFSCAWFACMFVTVLLFGLRYCQ